MKDDVRSNEAFSDQPPRDHPREDPERKPRKLGSLAQAARGKQLTSIRNLLLFIGILSAAVNVVVLVIDRNSIDAEIAKQVSAAGGPANVDPVQVQQLRDRAMLLATLIHGSFIALGVIFIVLALMVYHLPVPITILSLILYLVANLASAALNPPSLAQGFIVKIIVIVALAKAIQTAFAYEKNRREEELGPVG